MYHPWRTLPHDVVVEFASLPPPRRGVSRDRTIVLHNRQKQAERRCTLEHEKIHIERADMGKCQPELERDIDREVARRLVAFDALIDAMAWSSELEEIADELFVRPEIAQTRIDILRPAEVAIIAELIADLRAA